MPVLDTSGDWYACRVLLLQVRLLTLPTGEMSVLQ
jgi:hypothetical protein